MSETKIVFIKFWTWLGKISLFIGILYSSIQIYSLLFTDDYSIEANCHYSNFFIPPDLLDNVHDFQEKFSLDSLNKRILMNNKSEKLDVVWNIHSYLDEEFPKESVSKLSSYYSYYYFYVKNVGDKEISNAILDIPISGYFFLTKTKTHANPEIGEFSSKIELGNIRTSNEIKVSVWTSEGYLDESETRITYPEGEAKVKFSKRITSQVYFLDDPMDSIFFHFLLLLLGLFILNKIIYKTRLVDNLIQYIYNIFMSRK